MADYIPKTDKEKLNYLMETDSRRDGHIKELKLDIKNLGDNVNDLITVITGAKLNKKTGFVDLMDALDKKVDLLKKDVNDLITFQSTIEPQFNIGKWVFLTVVFIILGSVVNDVISIKENPKHEKIK